MSDRKDAGDDRPSPASSLGMEWLGKALSLLPVKTRLGLGARLARLAVACAPRRREVALRNLRIAFPEWSEAQRVHTFEESCRHLGRGLTELLTFGNESREALLDRVDVIGFENVERVRRESPTGGAIVLTAHLGNWEILAGLMRAHDLEIAVVKRGRDNLFLESGLTQLREKWGVELLTRGQAARGALRALRQGKFLAVPLDQNCSRNEGVFAPFFGRMACTRDGPARIAMRIGVPVVPCFIERVGTSDRHRVRILPPLPLEDGAGDWDKAVEENVTRMNAVIEAAIRETPDQWLWMHRRFHTQPEGEARPYPSRRTARRSVSD